MPSIYVTSQHFLAFTFEFEISTHLPYNGGMAAVFRGRGGFKMEAMLKYKGKKVVLDTRSSWIYIGILEEVRGDCVVLTDVDVHDNTDITTTKEIYVLESKKTGVKSNREKVYVNLNFLISFSALEDVKYF